MGSLWFGSVFDRVRDQRRDVAIAQAVVNVLSIASPDDEAVGAQHSETLRHRRHRVAGQCGKLGHAELAACELGDDAKAGRISERAEKLGRLIDHRLGRGSTIGQLVVGAGFVAHSIKHFIK